MSSSPKNPPTTPRFIVDPRPWPFTRAELTAGLRAYSGDPTLALTNLEERIIPNRRPSMGRIRGLTATCQTKNGPRAYELVLKEPQGTTRAGTAGAGKRELLFYRTLSNQLPVRVPILLAAHPDGDWLIFNLLENSLAPEQWGANEYLLATDQLVVIHDRFWNLGEDLAAYNWIARPLGSEYSIYMRAAYTGIRRLVDKVTSNLITRDPALIKMLKRLVDNANLVADGLRASPTTLLHGDYWPGNLAIYPDQTLTAFDWQQIAIGPGVLDLYHLIQASQWYFGELPLSEVEIVAHYREGLERACGQKWEDADWQRLWDFAMLWSFLVNRVDLLASIPAAILQTSFPQMQQLWLEPIQEAMSRRLPRE